MDKYCKPEIRTYSASDLIEVVGPIQAQYGSANIYGGRSAMLNTNKIAEYRFVKVDINYKLINEKEVSHA